MTRKLRIGSRTFTVRWLDEPVLYVRDEGSTRRSQCFVDIAGREILLPSDPSSRRQVNRLSAAINSIVRRMPGHRPVKVEWAV